MLNFCIPFGKRILLDLGGWLYGGMNNFSTFIK